MHCLKILRQTSIRLAAAVTDQPCYYTALFFHFHNALACKIRTINPRLLDLRIQLVKNHLIRSLGIVRALHRIDQTGGLSQAAIQLLLLPFLFFEIGFNLGLFIEFALFDSSFMVLKFVLK